ncbi:hypothetical protein JKF63_00837 [Porcisia hertigi]|uniref:Uncharacterized protein n=1 Tax=Porcisia hertigi TaxID=2761500 RepID=A0A836L1E9_9TRYP|nr:hypothetical protein JKF63_00837 [Porcisia hertigi]
MLARTVARLWTPRYFTRQVGVGRRLSKRRVRSLNTPDASCSTEAVKGEVTETPRTAPTCASQIRTLHGGSPPESAPPKPFAVLRSDQRRISIPQPTPSAPVRTENPLVQCAQKLLHLLSSTDHPQTSSPLGSSRGYAEFSARRDVFGPLRGLLPPHPATLSSGSAAKPASRHRFRVVPVMNGNLLATPPPPPQTNTTTDFSLAELTLFLRLYDSADVEDGQLLLQIMNEIRRHLFALAETVASNTTGEDNLEAGIGVGVEIMSQEPSASPLPLPGMLYTMASLGIAEEAVLEVVIKCTMRNGKPSRSGLLYPQLRFYPVKELLQLLVALQRFGHQQHFSTKAVVKMLRASFYNTRTVAGRFHKHARALKKALAARPGTPPSREGRCSVASTDADAGGVAAMTLADEELCSLAFMLECPLFLLLEALTTATTTVHRREDVVTFLSDLIAVTAVVELTTAVHEHRGRQGAASREELSQETQEFVFAVSYQLLRAAKLAESMEVPQLFLSDVFSWSTTLSGRGVVVDGDEDNAVPSDRVAYYDHVTADLIKLNSTE